MPSTVSSNTRATRSRLSSPQRKPNGAAEAAPASNGTEGSKKTFMQKWLEPPLQNKASFQEIGLQRHGVVENMAPLGTLPKAAMSKKLIAAAVRESSVGQDTSTPVSKKIILKRPNTTNNTPAAAIVAAPTEQEPEALTVPSKRRNYSAKVAEDDDDDGDYKPKSSGAVHQSAATPSSPSAGRIKVTRRSLAKPSPSRSAPDSLHHTTTTAADENLPRSENQENVDKVVEAAVDEALRHFRYPTAWALRTLYDENSSNPHFVSMFEQVFQQTATSETLRKFQRLLHDKKKEGKKDNKGCYYFVPPSTNSRFTPHKPRPAPYGDLVKLELPKMSASEPDAHVSKKLKTGKTRSTPASGKKAGSHGVNGSSRAHLESPLRNRGQRALSVGSDSSLSSAQSVSHPDEFGDEEMEDEEDRGRGGAVAGRPSAPGGSPSRAPAATQPIASRVRSVAAKKNGDVSPTPNPNSPSSIPDSAAPGMPALVDDPISFPNLQPATSSRKTRRSEKASPSPAPAALKFPSRFGPPDETDLRSQYRNSSRNCSESLKNAPESFVRGGRQSHGRDSSVPAKRKAAKELDEAEVATPKQQQQLSQLSRGPTTRSTRSSRKRAHDDVDDEASPTSLIFPPPPEPSSSRMNSRAGTPSNPRASKKPRTGPRVKNSPMKKKAGPSAGVPRASGERGSPVPNGPSNNQDENDDYCSSCGGNGELVCCDGCTRAFHFKCVDPPLLEGALPDEWYCNVCLVTRNPAALTQHSGCFSTLLNIIEKKNSSAFRLPADVRGYFEGVKTGTDGEYETVAPPASKTKKRGVYDDPPDFFRIRTPEGRATLCHNCSTSATDNRPIIPCSLCGLWWHIDCLDPPLANPPVLRTWVCPAHVDDLLAELPDSLAPAHKFRKIKGASVIKPAFRRGTVNNGFVEIDDDSETDAASGWKDVGSFGRLYRLPATGVKLDFISKVREKRRFRKSTKPVEPVPPRHDAVPSQPAPQQDSYLRNPQLIDQALATDNLRAATGHVDLLVEAMLSEANPSILAVMARGNALSIANDDEIATADLQSLQAARAQMEAMMARIDQRLQAANTRPAQAPVEQQEQQGGTAKKDVSTPTVTTPKPDEPVPSVKDQEAGADDIVVKTDGNSPANADIEDVAMATPAATTATEEKQDMADIDMASNPGDIPGDGETPKAKKTSSKDAEKLDAMLTPSTSPMATQADADANTDGGKITEPAKPDVVEKSEAGADWDMRMD